MASYDMYLNESYVGTKPTLKEAQTEVLKINKRTDKKYVPIIIRPGANRGKWEYFYNTKKWKKWI